MRPDTQNGLIIGGIAGVMTLGLNLLKIGLIARAGCPRRGTILPVVAFVLFVILAPVAGSRAVAGAEEAHSLELSPGPSPGCRCRSWSS
jgi:hypothetical protein